MLHGCGWRICWYSTPGALFNTAAGTVELLRLFRTSNATFRARNSALLDIVRRMYWEEQVQIISVESDFLTLFWHRLMPNPCIFLGMRSIEIVMGMSWHLYPLELRMLYSVISREAKEIPDLLDQLSPEDRLGEKQNRRFYQVPENYSKPGTPEFKLRQLSHRLTESQPNSYWKTWLWCII